MTDAPDEEAEAVARALSDDLIPWVRALKDHRRILPNTIVQPMRALGLSRPCKNNWIDWLFNPFHDCNDELTPLGRRVATVLRGKA
jgi:hypothetical protein